MTKYKHIPQESPQSIRRKLANFIRPYPRLRSFILRTESIIKLPFKFFTFVIGYAVERLFRKREYLISRANATYFGDRFATMNYVAFLHDEKFKKAYNDTFALVDVKKAYSVRSLDISWRAHIVTWAANQALKLEGDFVECGVWYGFLSRVICQYVDFETHPNKKFYLVDTWGDPEDNDKNHCNYKEDVFEVVKERFKDYPNIEFVRGFVPDILNSIQPRKISYLSIDMNGAIAERKTLERYYDLIVPGGVIYFDDYGWNYPELRNTVDEFFSDKPEKLLHFPSGNSIVVKL